MLLTIDVGNTNITVGVIEEQDVKASFRLTTSDQKTSDELGMSLVNFLNLKSIHPSEIDGAVISCVVPKIMYSLNNAIRKYFNLSPLVIGPGIKTGIKIKTENPKEVGADRLVNVAACHEIYHKNCLVIDFGTATTFDYISSDGTFEYTVITPGIQIAANALVSNAAKLPEIEIKKPHSILAKNTIVGMQAGLVYGYIGQVEYIVKKMREEISEDFLVVATGGLGRIIYEYTDCIDIYEPNIAYIGMEIIYKKNSNLS
ncbi:MAG: type III pantothenate kinase [Erysipelotrichaceae bacterium]